MHPITKAIRTQAARTKEMEHSSPLFLTSSFCYNNAEEMRAAFADEIEANIYTRFSNPTVQEFIDKICVLEGAASGFATASGMSAIFCIIYGPHEARGSSCLLPIYFWKHAYGYHQILTKVWNRLYLC